MPNSSIHINFVFNSFTFDCCKSVFIFFTIVVEAPEGPSNLKTLAHLIWKQLNVVALSEKKKSFLCVYVLLGLSDEAYFYCNEKNNSQLWIE